MARSKTGGKTRRERYDEILLAAYHKTCKDCIVLGFEFPTEERAILFHYSVLVLDWDNYYIFDLVGCRAVVVAKKAEADNLRAAAKEFDGTEYRVRLDEEI